LGVIAAMGSIPQSADALARSKSNDEPRSAQNWQAEDLGILNLHSRRLVGS
jgi:hypothetical protein